MRTNLIIFTVLFVLSFGAFAQNQDEVEFEFNFETFDHLDTLYILPQQHLWLQYDIRSATNENETEENAIVAIQAEVSWNYNFEDADNLWYHWNHPDYNGGSIDDVVYYLTLNGNVWTYRALMNTFPTSFWSVGRLDYYNNLSPGEYFQNYYIGNIIDTDLQEHWITAEKTFICTDGYLGDVNGDQVVDYADLYTLLEYIHHDWQGWYTDEGLNYCRGSVMLRNYPNLLDVTILNIWLQNPNDPRVAGLGIGMLMSETAPPPSVPFTSTITGESLSVETGGNAVCLSAFLDDGTFWQESAWVTDGMVSIAIPDPNLDYQIEAIQLNSTLATDHQNVSLPKKFQLNQNYPNPFNPSTTIEYTLLANSQVDLTVYTITGETVMTIVNDDQVAGDYSVTVDLGKENLSSGIYLYRLTTPQKQITRKLSYVK